MSALIFTRDLHWIFRELPVPDIGIDALVEVVSEGEATGEWIALQVKSGESFFREKSAEGFVYRGDADHLEYWLNLPIPTLLVLCSSETTAAGGSRSTIRALNTQARVGRPSSR